MTTYFLMGRKGRKRPSLQASSLMAHGAACNAGNNGSVSSSSQAAGSTAGNVCSKNNNNNSSDHNAAAASRKSSASSIQKQQQPVTSITGSAPAALTAIAHELMSSSFKRKGSNGNNVKLPSGNSIVNGIELLDNYSMPADSIPLVNKKIASTPRSLSSSSSFPRRQHHPHFPSPVKEEESLLQEIEENEDVGIGDEDEGEEFFSSSQTHVTNFAEDRSSAKHQHQQQRQEQHGAFMSASPSLPLLLLSSSPTMTTTACGARREKDSRGDAWEKLRELGSAVPPPPMAMAFIRSHAAFHSHPNECGDHTHAAADDVLFAHATDSSPDDRMFNSLSQRRLIKETNLDDEEDEDEEQESSTSSPHPAGNSFSSSCLPPNEGTRNVTRVTIQETKNAINSSRRNFFALSPTPPPLLPDSSLPSSGKKSTKSNNSDNRLSAWNRESSGEKGNQRHEVPNSCHRSREKDDTRVATAKSNEIAAVTAGNEATSLLVMDSGPERTSDRRSSSPSSVTGSACSSHSGGSISADLEADCVRLSHQQESGEDELNSIREDLNSLNRELQASGGGGESSGRRGMREASVESSKMDWIYPTSASGQTCHPAAGHACSEPVDAEDELLIRELRDEVRRQERQRKDRQKLQRIQEKHQHRNEKTKDQDAGRSLGNGEQRIRISDTTHDDALLDDRRDGKGRNSHPLLTPSNSNPNSLSKHHANQATDSQQRQRQRMGLRGMKNSRSMDMPSVRKGRADRQEAEEEFSSGRRCDSQVRQHHQVRQQSQPANQHNNSPLDQRISERTAGSPDSDGLISPRTRRGDSDGKRADHEREAAIRSKVQANPGSGSNSLAKNSSIPMSPDAPLLIFQRKGSLPDYRSKTESLILSASHHPNEANLFIPPPPSAVSSFNMNHASGCQQKDPTEISHRNELMQNHQDKLIKQERPINEASHRNAVSDSILDFVMNQHSAGKIDSSFCQTSPHDMKHHHEDRRGGKFPAKNVNPETTSAQQASDSLLRRSSSNSNTVVEPAVTAAVEQQYSSSLSPASSRRLHANTNHDREIEKAAGTEAVVEVDEDDGLSFAAGLIQFDGSPRIRRSHTTGSKSTSEEPPEVPPHSSQWTESKIHPSNSQPSIMNSYCKVLESEFSEQEEDEEMHEHLYTLNEAALTDAETGAMSDVQSIFDTHDEEGHEGDCDDTSMSSRSSSRMQETRGMLANRRQLNQSYRTSVLTSDDDMM